MRRLALLLALSLPPVVGCGPKKPTTAQTTPDAAAQLVDLGPGAERIALVGDILGKTVEMSIGLKRNFLEIARQTDKGAEKIAEMEAKLAKEEAEIHARVEAIQSHLDPRAWRAALVDAYTETFTPAETAQLIGWLQDEAWDEVEAASATEPAAGDFIAAGARLNTGSEVKENDPERYALVDALIRDEMKAGFPVLFQLGGLAALMMPNHMAAMAELEGQQDAFWEQTFQSLDMTVILAAGGLADVSMDALHRAHELRMEPLFQRLESVTSEVLSTAIEADVKAAAEALPELEGGPMGFGP